MKHYSDIVKERVLKITEARLSYVECDECDKKISASEGTESQRIYIRVHTWHNDWGNDSCESHEYVDLCPDCAVKYVTEYIRNMEGTEELECRVEHAHSSDRMRRKVVV